jgi:hypothetical protein
VQFSFIKSLLYLELPAFSVKQPISLLESTVTIEQFIAAKQIVVKPLQRQLTWPPGLLIRVL